MSRILLTHSYHYPLDRKQWKNRQPFPPLGTLYAAAQLRQNGYLVDLYDTNLRKDVDLFRKYLQQSQPSYVILYDDGFNYLTKMCLTEMREAAFDMIALAKARDCQVICCSSDATDQFTKYIEAGADYIVAGEGERTLIELVHYLEGKSSLDRSEIAGIIYSYEEGIARNPSRPVLKELDSLVQPAWDLVDMEEYRAIWNESGQPFTLNIATTRGCPYKCNWCAKPIYGNRYNAHSPTYIVDQIEYHVTHHGVHRFWMCDDIFGLKPGWVQEFNRLLQKRDLQIQYYIQSRVDLLLKEDTIQALAESGLQKVWLGAESGSQAILDAMDKGTTVEQIYEATYKLKQHGIQVAFFLQFGYLGEQWSDIQKTIRMVLDLLPDDIGISVSYPLPGTGFYERVKQDLIHKSNWKDSDDLDLMFKSTFPAGFYKVLHRYVHNRYRIQRGLRALSHYSLRRRSSLKKTVLDSARMVFHLPQAIYHRILLYTHISAK